MSLSKKPFRFDALCDFSSPDTTFPSRAGTAWVQLTPHNVRLNPPDVQRHIQAFFFFFSERMACLNM